MRKRELPGFQIAVPTSRLGTRLPGDHTVSSEQVPSQSSTPLKVVSASFTCVPTSQTGPSEQPTDTECSGGLDLAPRLPPGLDLNAEASVVQLELWCSMRQDSTGLGRQRRVVFHPEGFIINHSALSPVRDLLGLGRAGERKYKNCIPPGPSGCACASPAAATFPFQSPQRVDAGVEPCPSAHMPPNSENSVGYSGESKNEQENYPLRDFFSQ